MTIGDIYKSKKDDSIIQIDSFAKKDLKDKKEEFIIVFKRIEKNLNIYGSCPSFNGYGTKEEIEDEYELLVSAFDIRNYYDWNQIFELLKI